MHFLKSILKKSQFAVSTNACLKRYIQEYRAARDLKQYQREAARLNINCPQGEYLQRALQLRLAERAQGRWPKRKGSLHLFLAYYVSNWEVILPVALTPFGRVTAFNWREHGFRDSAPDWLDHRDDMNKEMLATFHRANREQPVDAVISYLSGYNTSRQTLTEMAKCGAAIFNFCWDDKLNFPGKRIGGRYPSPAEIASVVDLNLTNSPDSLIKYAVHGGLAMFWPEAAHPDVHRHYDVPFEFDVSFVGACYGWRPAFMRQLARRGIKVACFGKGWPNGPLDDENMIKLYSRSRINLGFSSIGYAKRLMCLKGRDFEIPMSGGLYLTQHNPELTLVYRVGEEILTYRGVEDCAATIRSLLDNPLRAAEIRAKGRARALREHTYETRWGNVFKRSGIMC
jgi:hypothetical protein